MKRESVLQTIYQKLLLFLQFDPSKMDRIELAFRKFDLNQDGFLSRDEFDLVSCFQPFISANNINDLKVPNELLARKA